MVYYLGMRELVRTKHIGCHKPHPLTVYNVARLMTEGHVAIIMNFIADIGLDDLPYTIP